MILQFDFLLLIAAIGFGVSSLIETTSWALRAMSNKSNQGLFNAKANIYLYGGRFFALLFMMILSLIVDHETNLHQVVFFIAISVSFAALLQVLYRHSNFFFLSINRIMIFLFLKKISNVNLLITQHKIDNRLFINSWLATLILVFGVTSPYLLASLFPNIRMTISTFGQVINAIGTIILLFKVDPILYQRMDKNDLNIHVFSYIKGRYFGLLTTSIIFWVLLLIIP
jgi:hypothetical protein